MAPKSHWLAKIVRLQMTDKPMRHLPSPAPESGDGPMTLHQLSLFAYDVHALAQGLEILVGEVISEGDPSPASNAACLTSSMLVGMAEKLASEINRAESASKRVM